MAIPRFEELIENHHAEVFRYLWRLCRGAHAREPASVAQDLTQDTYLRAYEAYDRLRPDSNVRAWLFKIATNRARSEFRKTRPRPIGDQALTAPDRAGDRQAVEDQTVRRERDRRLRSALGGLPVKQRTAVTLRHLQGLDYESVALVLECSLESARANVYQGLRHLRRVLDTEEMSL